MSGHLNADDPAPLLRALHEAQAEKGIITRKELESLAKSLRLSLADLYSAATFYHYFTIEGKEPLEKAMCHGPVCSLPGVALQEERGLPSISCPGLCDQPRARFDAGRFLSGPGTVGAFRSPERGNPEAVFRRVSTSDPHGLQSYLSLGGYEQLLKLTRTGGVPAALDLLEASGLLGRGGAAFPLAAKLRAVCEAPAGPKYVVCNADEGEPGTFKDRPILHLQPHALLEGMAIAGVVAGAETGVIYLRYEYPQAMEVLSKAIAEAEDGGLLGKKIAGSGVGFSIHLRRGAGSYVCGEETALLNSLEGRRPWPRERPPFPSAHGLWGRPTAINNVETFAWIPLILEKGPEWFRSLGRGENAGTKIYSVSGRVERPGNYELPLGVTARELIFDSAGGPPPGHRLKAFTVGGISGGLLGAQDLDLSLDYRSPQKHGAFLGSGGVVVLDDGCCTVEFVRTCMLFYERESCGKCYPCRIGTVRLRELLDGLTGRAELCRDAESQMQQISSAMVGTSACGLGQSAPLVVTGMFKLFGDEVNAHLAGRSCPAGVCRL